MCKSTPAPGWMMARLFLATVTKWRTVETGRAALVVTFPAGHHCGSRMSDRGAVHGRGRVAAEAWLAVLLSLERLPISPTPLSMLR